MRWSIILIKVVIMRIVVFKVLGVRWYFVKSDLDVILGSMEWDFEMMRK